MKDPKFYAPYRNFWLFFFLSESQQGIKGNIVAEGIDMRKLFINACLPGIRRQFGFS